MSSGIKSAAQAGSRSDLGVMPNIVLIGMILMVTLRPVFAEDFWWRLAQGRAVWEGYFRPSQQLLAFEANSDADWLGGLPWYMIYQLGGANVISWLPPLIVTLAGFTLARQIGGRTQSWRRVALVLLGVVAINQSVAPSSALFDLAGVMAFWRLANARSSVESPRTLAALWFGQFLWSNFAPLSVLGPILVCCNLASGTERSCRSDSRRQSVSQGRLWRCLLGLLIAGSLTPRGFYTFWDSLRTLLPWTVVSLNNLNQAGMQSVLKWPLPLEGYAFLALLAICMFHRAREAAAERTSTVIFALIASTMIAFSSRVSFGPAALWLTLQALSLSNQRFTAERPSIEPDRERPKFFRMLLTGLLAVSTLMAAGRIPDQPARIGWGIAPQLEPLLIEHVLRNHPVEGTAYCTGVAEAGMLAWIRPGSLRPADVPCRALLSGRLKGHLYLESDLACGWRDQHRRSQAGWGGWLLELSKRRTRLLLLSPQRTQVIRELENANWKPLAIDTPCLPYALAGDPILSPGIVFAQSSLNLVDHGEWTYAEPQPAGTGSHFDLYGWLTGRADPLISVRQSQTLYAMERYTAALRVLQREVQRKNRAAQLEFTQNQFALAYREYLATGSGSEWRTLAYALSGGRRQSPALIPMEATNPTANDLKPLIPAASAYVAGDWKQARDQLQSLGTPSALLALSQIELELGHPQTTAQVIRELLAKFPDSPASIAGQYVLTQISD